MKDWQWIMPSWDNPGSVHVGQTGGAPTAPPAAGSPRRKLLSRITGSRLGSVAGKAAQALGKVPKIGVGTAVSVGLRAVSSLVPIIGNVAMAIWLYQMVRDLFGGHGASGDQEVPVGVRDAFMRLQTTGDYHGLFREVNRISPEAGEVLARMLEQRVEEIYKELVYRGYTRPRAEMQYQIVPWLDSVTSQQVARLQQMPMNVDMSQYFAAPQRM